MAAAGSDYLQAILVVLLGATIGALWHMTSWVQGGGSGGLAWEPVTMLLLFATLGAVAQPWLRPGSTVALACATIAGNVVAATFSEDFDEEHLGHDPGRVLFAVVFFLVLSVGVALAAHGLVGALRSLARRRREGSPKGP